jgi:hypothetical protein
LNQMPRKTKTSSPLSREIWLEDPKDFRKKALRDIRQAFNDNSLEVSFQMNQSGKNCTFYPVGGLNPVKIEDQFVYPLARDSRGRLYFSGFASVFGMDREGYEFQSISMRIWSGLTTDDQKKLLRAEWEPYGIDSSKNAQPHWQLDDIIVAPDSNSPYAPILRKFHFAMSSSWSKDEECQHHVDSFAILTTWMKNCLLYVKSQIELLG